MSTEQRTLTTIGEERIRQRPKIDLRSREAIAAYLFLAPFLIFFSIFTVRAVAYAVQMSFFDWQVLRPTRTYIELGNYKELLNDQIWWLSVKNTIVFALMT